MLTVGRVLFLLVGCADSRMVTVFVPMMPAAAEQHVREQCDDRQAGREHAKHGRFSI